MLTSAFQELTRTGYPVLQQVSLVCEQDQITLDGEVPNYFLKQVAQAALQNLPGVTKVVNRLRVTASLRSDGLPDPNIH